MAITLRTLYHETKNRYRLELHAGENGLDHVMQWIYIAEDIENTIFLKGGELIICTGMGIQNQDNWLLHFVEELACKNISGLILNIGRYIQLQDIDSELCALCNQYQIPLFSMPWEIHIADLSQDYTNRIFQFQQQKNMLASAFGSMIRDSQPSWEALDTLDRYGYLQNDSYALAILDFTEPVQYTRKPQESLLESINHYTAIHHCNAIFFSFQTYLLFVWHKTSETEIRQYMKALYQFCDTRKLVENLYLGISSVCPSYNALTHSHKEALAALQMAKHSDQKIYSFSDFGVFRIFFSCNNKDILKEYVTEHLGVLEDFDKTHETRYVETLDTYLNYNGQIAKVADALICHRNTINYRIRKIRELLPIDLDDGRVRFELLLACCIRDYINIFFE